MHELGGGFAAPLASSLSEKECRTATIAIGKLPRPHYSNRHLKTALRRNQIAANGNHKEPVSTQTLGSFILKANNRNLTIAMIGTDRSIRVRWRDAHALADAIVDLAEFDRKNT